MDSADREARFLTDQAKDENNPSEKSAKLGRASLKELEWRFKKLELDELCNRTHADRSSPGRFTILAPTMNAEESNKVYSQPPVWSILNSNFREQMPVDRTVRPNEPIIRLGAKNGEWELEMKIPQKHVGQVLRAFKKNGYDKPLDVEFIMLG